MSANSAPQLVPDESSNNRVDEGAVASLERAAVRAPAWPGRQLARTVAATVLLASLWVPVAAFASTPATALATLLPTVLASLVTRLLFEALAGTSAPRIGIAALAAAVLGVLLVSLVALSFSVEIPTLAWAPALAACTVTLGLAATVRSFEIRLGASSRRIFFVGGRDQQVDLSREAVRRGDMSLVGFVDPSGLSVHAGSPEWLVEQVTRARATTLVMSTDAVRHDEIVTSASRLNLRGVRVRTLNDFYETQFTKVPLSELSQAWFLFDVAEIHDARLYGIAKRVVESCVATLVLLVFAPALPLIAVAVKLSSAGPVLYRQRRVGKDGSVFSVTKFRTMELSTAPERASWSTEHAHRITRAGRFLRRFRLDELPQLWKVVRGDLSLVGPRPEQPEIVERLEREMKFYAARHCIRPGLTGWAQVNYGYGGDDLGVVEKLQYDFFYIKRQSLRLDLLIIASTVRIILSGRGH
jgi:exopolysaccharide biosynthesis polyprenyl glycosylphosphotransferase